MDSAQGLEIRGVAVDEHMVAVSDGAELRVFACTPRAGATEPPVVFVAGWVSVVTGWLPLLEALAPNRQVWYLETREKPSARIPGRLMVPAAFSLTRLARDLIEVCDQLGVDGRSATCFGSSMGANAILEALKGGGLAAGRAFLIGPNGGFHFPWWSRWMLHVPASTYVLLRPFVLWYLRHFRVDARREPEQMRRYERTLAAADPERLKLSAMGISGYLAWPGLDTINAPVAVAYAASDSLHREPEILRLVGAIPGACAVECPTNRYMHSADVAEDIDAFVAATSAAGPGASDVR